MDASRRHVGRHQGLRLASLELAKGSLSLRLAAVTMDRHGGDARGAQLACNTICTTSSATEDDGRAHLGHDVGEDVESIIALDRPEEVIDVALCVFIARHVVACRVGLIARGQRFDLFAHGGGEQENLSIRLRLLDDAAYARHEAHVGHPVGLIDDEQLDVGEIDHPLLDQIFQPPGARHEDVDALGERSLGRSVAGTAIDGDDLLVAVGAQ